MKRQISRENFVKSLYPYINPNILDYEQFFKIKGGRGAIQTIQKRMNEELVRSSFFAKPEIPKLQEGYSINKIFISGIGTLTIEHEPQLDKVTVDKDNKPVGGMNFDAIGGLPEKTYNYQLYNNDNQLIAELSAIEEFTPLQETLEYVEEIKSHIEKVNKLLEKIEKVK